MFLIVVFFIVSFVLAVPTLWELLRIFFRSFVRFVSSPIKVIKELWKNRENFLYGFIYIIFAPYFVIKKLKQEHKPNYRLACTSVGCAFFYIYLLLAVVVGII